MAATTLKQYIKFKEQLLPISRKQTYEEAIDHYSGTYPELTNAVKEKQFTEAGKVIHQVKTAIGQKG